MDAVQTQPLPPHYLHINQYIYINPKPLKLPQFSTSAQLKKKKTANPTKKIIIISEKKKPILKPNKRIYLKTLTHALPYPSSKTQTQLCCSSLFSIL